MLDNVLSHVLPHVLMQRTEISFHVQGVPDPLYGPWYARTLSPSDEAEAAIAAYQDTSRVPGAQLREVDAFLRARFNAHSERPTFRTYACNYRMIVVADTLHLSSVSNVAAVNRAWMRAVVQEISGRETVILHHLINTSNAGRIRLRVPQDDSECGTPRPHDTSHCATPLRLGNKKCVCSEHNKRKSGRESSASALALSACEISRRLSCTTLSALKTWFECNLACLLQCWLCSRNSY